MIAHVGGLPIEEWLVPVAAIGGSVAIAVREVFRRMRA